MTSEQRKEMRDFRDTLPDDLREYFDRMVEKEGEEKVYGKLGHLRSQAEYIGGL